MMFARYSSILLVFMLFTNIHFEQTGAIEPLTIGAIVGVSSALYGGYELLKCKLVECCGKPWFHANITGLHHDLKSKLHGQHMVVETVVKSILGHVKYSEPSKALVLSFHGTTGCGKNFAAKIIADNLYHEGCRSKYVHLFHAPTVFPHESMLPQYKDDLHKWISGNVSECSRNLFIFDEMDKMPAGLINVIKPFLDHYENLRGVDYRKNLFIFLSNTGGKEINDYALQQWQSGRNRSEITYSELEQLLIRSAFNDKGGLWHSSLIDHNLISAFIPFLPLEKQHVKLCIEDDIRSKGLSSSTKLNNFILEEMQYMPSDIKLYSTTGCKRVSEKVNLYVELN